MILLKSLTPKQSLNKAYLKQKVNRSEFEIFKKNLFHLLNIIDETESEEHLKNQATEFLNDTFYKNKYYINTKDRKDLVIHNEDKSTSKVGVLLEAKRPNNTSEMITKADFNKKALQELLLYYLRERVDEKNNDLKHLVITNTYEWFIFDAQIFEALFYKNSKLIKEYEQWKSNQKTSTNNDLFYNEIAKKYISQLTEITFTYFDLRDYVKDKENPKDEKKLIPLFKIFSPIYLLKQPFTNDSNSLDKSFYNELLHIIGLEEVKVKNKRLIQRKAIANREEASLLENTINYILTRNILSRIEGIQSYGKDEDERVFNFALELCIIWINRILFLKLLEAQLYSYHGKDSNYEFLNESTINDFDELDKLFFEVLAQRVNERTASVKEKFKYIPYLNSSLFEPNKLESESLFISNLDGSKNLSIYSSTSLKDELGKKLKGEKPTLNYLFEFLDSYDFASEGKEEIQEKDKSLINASVLGLIFEKINGYKDGSFFTPGYITMYMSRETVSRAIVQKFNDKYKWKCEDLSDLKNYLADKRNKKDILEANEIINSLTICDPAIGSGHFLVSILNEIIAIKSELGILADNSGLRLSDYDVKVENDELIVTYNEGTEIFGYHVINGKVHSETQRIQKTLFHEKQNIIENSLFGVDINPNSVRIARLRLWIELLKNTYYTEESNFLELETLPNIDINIKQGNSLVSRFRLDIDIREILKSVNWKITDYKNLVNEYKNESNKENKIAIRKLIDDIKNGFRLQIKELTPKRKKLNNMIFKLHNTFQTERLFELTAKEKSKLKKDEEKLLIDIDKLKLDIEKIEESDLFEEAFEWRFEFPEILEYDGNFLGFDIVIGNPPYFSLSKIKEYAHYFKNSEFATYVKGTDIYCLFYERGNQILRQNGLLTYITSNSWLRVIYGKVLREFFSINTTPIQLLNIEDVQLFEEATVESNILTFKKGKSNSSFLVCNLSNNYVKETSLKKYFAKNSFVFSDYESSEWVIGNREELNLKQKIEYHSKPLKEFRIKINFGIKTGYNKAFIINEEIKEKLINEDSSNAQIVKPILRGRDLTKFNYTFSKNWIISTFPSLNLNINDYPKIKEYLLSYGQKRLEQSGEKGSRKKTFNNWFETQDSIGYWKELNKPKIVWGEISDTPKFAYDENNYYAEATTFFMTGEKLKFLLGILNSNVSAWYFNQISTTTGMGTNRWKKYKIELLPIKNSTEEQEKTIVNKVNQILELKKQNSSSTNIELELEQLVYELYELTEEEIKLVEEI